MFALRAATAEDAEAVAAVWHRGWADGHHGHVPAELYQHRRPADFRSLVPARLDTTTVATVGDEVVGFVTVHGDEIEQVYVDASARGAGVAAALLRRGEEAVAARFESAWLAVVAGNARARRFYAREGWRDEGLFEYEAEVATGTVVVLAHRYAKRVQGEDR